MYDVVTIGDVVFDIFIKPEELGLFCPRGMRHNLTCFEPVLCLPYGAKIPISEVHYDIGGSAANVAVGLKRLGLQTALISAIGIDERGEEVLGKLKKQEVDLIYVQRLKGIKTNFSIIINYKGERTILVYRGLPDYAKLKIPKTIKTRWIYLAPLGHGFEKIYKDVVNLVSTKGIFLGVNPGGIQIEEKNSAFWGLLKVTKILFLNKEEAEKICEVKRPVPISTLLCEIKEMGPEIVVITDGSNGAYCFDGNDYLKISAYGAGKKERTGAGDAFATGFLAAISLEKEIKEAMQWGVINAAYCIKEIGAQKGLLTRRQLEVNLRKAPWPKNFE